MSKGLPEYFPLQRYNISPEDVVRLILRCEPEDIRRHVIITPDWKEEEFFPGKVEDIEPVSGDHLFEVTYRDKKISFIRSGIGAPLTGDVVLALGCTECTNLIFTGSFGGLADKLIIGDLLLLTESTGGDGFSNYLNEGELTTTAFLKPAYPDTGLIAILEEHAVSLSEEAGVALHRGSVFSTDSIVAQFHHLDWLIGQFGCIGIEMETSAVFNAAALVGIKAAALLEVSDVIPTRKSLFSGRTEEDRQRYKHIKKSVLSRIILDTLCDERLK